MRAYADFFTALIFRSPALQKHVTDFRSKNRRLEKVILIGTQRVLLSLAILFSLSVLLKCHIIRPSGQV